jgi:Beta/Gamma crystallin
MPWHVTRLPRACRQRIAWVPDATLLAVCIGWWACNSPTAPSPVTEGVAIYQHPRFRGDSRTVTADLVDLDDVYGGCERSFGAAPIITYSYHWDDCISSIRVAPGWNVTVYEDPRYRGDSLTLTADTEDLEDVTREGGDWDDRISSIRVFRR